MKLSRFAIVLALVTAAAVLFPLRRARAAFAPGAAVPNAPAARRGPTRRRPSRPRAILRVQPTSDTHDSTAATAAPRVGVARRRITISAPVYEAAGHLATERSQSVSHTSHDNTGGDAGDCVLTSATRLPRPEETISPNPTPRVTAVTQAVTDVPKPPPKPARC